MPATPRRGGATYKYLKRFCEGTPGRQIRDKEELKMKKGLTELVMILDRSGSMGGLESDTIGGFNSLIQKQKKEEGEAYVSVVLFDDVSEVIYDRVSINKVEPMTDKQYYVRGCTALLDAIGGAIRHIATVHKYARPEDVPEKTLFIITTDGLENASKHFSYADVRRMIEKEKEKYGWEFIFMGANMDAVAEAARFGIKASRAVRFENDGEGQQINYDVMSSIVTSARMACSAAAMSDMLEEEELMAPIKHHYDERSKKKVK